MRTVNEEVEKAFGEEARTALDNNEINDPQDMVRSYEAAKEFMAALLSNGSTKPPRELAREAWLHAQALVKSFETTH